MLLVGTKSDLREDKARSSSLVSSIHGHALAREIGAAKYLECSAAKQDNLTTIFEEAVRTALNPPKAKKKKGGGQSKCRIM